jgi:phosphoenolpyruvate carboxykinase (ATP)
MTPSLEGTGLAPAQAARWNATPAALQECAVRRGEGTLSAAGVLCVVTRPHTGRSPDDKFFVVEPGSRERLWWTRLNQPLSEEHYARLREHVIRHLNQKQLFVQEVYAGADPRHRLAIRLVTASAWHALFASNMFLRPGGAGAERFAPDWHILHAPDLDAIPAEHGTRSGTFIVIHLGARTMLIGGTKYAGEVKKAVFTTLNYLLPEAGVLPMHCGATLGAAGDVALFFGLSGTGKTTLSTDPERALIGDDEHGWSDEGVFNFEGGCYAKVIRLSPEREPTIYATTRMPGTVLENVVVDPATGRLDLDSAAITENTRASYPIDFVPNRVPSGMSGHPSHIMLLTCDAYGVMPPIARLSPAQSAYHFLSGYTARVAGTERGVSEPTATFSTCFAAPFLPLPPGRYAALLGDKIARHGVQCWSVNTGWTEGAYGTGRRIPLEYTRAMVRAALSGALGGVPTTREPVFGLDVPLKVPGVPDAMLLPRRTWADPAAYDAQAAHVADLFRHNFEQFADHVAAAVRRAGPAL